MALPHSRRWRLKRTGANYGIMEHRLGVDIGGTFTDVALESGARRYTSKVLTTRAPERGVLQAIEAVLAEARLAPAALSIIIHGTTLATNALIERKGAAAALVTTEGFRDTIEIRHENRFEQYDVGIDLPPPLVPRRRRLPVRERIDAQGRVLVPLDEQHVHSVVDEIERLQVGAVAVGFLHSFTNPAHELRVGAILAQRLPGVSVTLSCEVSPEMREYERFSTACANAYLQPLIATYLGNLRADLAAAGIACPLFLMLSGGGLTTIETAIPLGFWRSVGNSTAKSGMRFSFASSSTSELSIAPAFSGGLRTSGSCSKPPSATISRAPPLA